MEETKSESELREEVIRNQEYITPRYSQSELDFIRQKDRESLVEMVRGMNRQERAKGDLTMYVGYGHPETDYRTGYNQCLADLEQAINKIMK